MDENDIAAGTCKSLVQRTVNSDVSTIFQPLNEHVKTLIGQLIPELRRMLVTMTEVVSGVIFFNTAPANQSS